MLCSWVGRINIIEVCILPKAIYRFNAIPTIIQMTFHRFRTNISKIYMEPKMTPNSFNNLEKEEQSRGDHSTRYQTILQGHCNKVWSWHKNRHIDQWNRIKEPRNKPKSL